MEKEAYLYHELDQGKVLCLTCQRKGRRPKGSDRNIQHCSRNGSGGRVFIFGFADILGKFSFDLGFFHENDEISAPPPCGFLIGIYKFYENWSTETFRKRLEEDGLVAGPISKTYLTG